LGLASPFSKEFYPVSFLDSKSKQLLSLIKMKDDSNSYPASWHRERESELCMVARDYLVANRLLSEEVKKEGITVSDEGVRARLAERMPEVKIDSMTQELPGLGQDSDIVLNELRAR